MLNLYLINIAAGLLLIAMVAFLYWRVRTFQKESRQKESPYYHGQYKPIEPK